MLSSATHYTLHPEFGGKWKMVVSQWKQSVSTLGSRIPSAYLQNAEVEAKKRRNVLLLLQDLTCIRSSRRWH